MITGVSAAVPHVSGLAGLILSHTLDTNGDNTLTPAEVQAIIQFSADDSAGSDGNWDAHTGYGLIDAGAAIVLADDWAESKKFQLGADGESYFNDLGHLMIKGTFHWDADPSELAATAGKELIIQKGSGADPILARFDYATGDLWLKGEVYENLASTDELDPSQGSGDNAFIIKRETGDEIVAYISSNGNLHLKGRLFAAEEPDRIHFFAGLSRRDKFIATY